MPKRTSLALRLKPLAWLLLGMSAGVHALGGITTEDIDQRASALGWVKDNKANICGGYYVEPNVGGGLNESNDVLQKQAVEISADQTHLQTDGASTLSGKVIVKQPGRYVQSDQAVLLRNAKTKEITATDLTGNVVSREPSKVVVGDRAHINLLDHSGDYYDVIYRMGVEFQPISFTPLPDNQQKVHGMIAQGNADKFSQTKPGYYVLKHVTYSTCAPTANSWVLKSKTLNIDHENGHGTAWNATLFVKGIPVLYTPYFDFPIDKRRMSGFLMPYYSNSTNNGLSISTPYYWNLAPNYDMTLTPSWYSKRGLQLNTQNRYLTEINHGEVDLGFLPNDRAFQEFKDRAPVTYAGNVALTKLENSSDNRSFYAWKDDAKFNANWHGNIDFTRVSDDYYQQDFGLRTPVPNQLLEQGTLNYNNAFLSSQLQVQNYQTLHPVTLLPTGNQYSRMPDLTVNLNPPPNNYFTPLFNGEAVYFKRSLSPGETQNTNSGQPTQGTRLNAEPGISVPFIAPAGYITPTLQYELTQYSLNTQQIGYNNSIYRSLPIFDIDSGLYFDRDVSFAKTDYQQTLEPRLYYLYVPYKDQYQIPVFDSGIQPFTFDQLFKNNRFSGIDRIGDANQISLALTSRLLDADSGAEKMRMGIGRIYYAHNRQVMLCNTAGCQDSLYSVGITSPTETASPVVGFFNYNLNSKWSTVSNLAYDPHTHQVNNGNLNIQYQPQRNHLVNFGYNFIQYGDPYSPPTATPDDPRNNLNQVSASFAWPITQSVSTMAGWNYNVSHQHFQTYLYGMTYNTCCYAVRLAAGRTFISLSGTGVPQYNKQIYLQLILKGLGGVGKNNALDAFTGNIPGYQDDLSQSVL